MRYFRCPDGQTQSIKKCTAGNCRMAHRCKPLPFLMVAGDMRESVPREYSVTQLLNGTRENYLKIQDAGDIVIDPNDRAFAILGTASHSKLEQEAPAVLESEVSMVYPIANGITLTGTADLVEEQPTGEIWLIDHKTSGSYKTGKAIGMSAFDVGTGEFYKSGARKGQEKTKKQYKLVPENIDIDDWIRQLNMYRIMYEKKSGNKISALKIFNVVRDGGTIASKSRGITENTYYIDIPIISDGIILDYYIQKATELAHCVETGDLPDVCSPEERWDDNKCRGYCDVAKYCPYGQKIQEETK
jgi:hypothetical protein